MADFANDLPLLIRRAMVVILSQIQAFVDYLDMARWIIIRIIILLLLIIIIIIITVDR